MQTILKTTVYHKSALGTVPEIGKTDDATSTGFVEGYVARYGNVDLQGDIIFPGAFAKSIVEAVPRGVPLMVVHLAHGGDGLEAVGKVVEAREDSVGLWIRADYSPDPLAQTIRQRVNAKVIKFFSVGFRPIRGEIVKREDGTVGANLYELAFADATLTCRPANELTEIANAKTIGEDSPESPQGTLALDAENAPAPRVVSTSKTFAAMHDDDATLAAHTLTLERILSHE